MKKRQIKKNRYCPHCHNKLTYSKVKGGYAYECKCCDEDFFRFEAKEKAC